MLRTRVATALLLLPPVVAAVLWLPPPWLTYLIAAMIGIGAWEWAQFASIQRPWVRGLFATIITFAIVAATSALPVAAIHGICWAAIGVWVLGLFWLRHISLWQQAGRGANSAKFLFGSVILLAAGLALATLATQLANGRYWTLYLLVLIWAADIGAYTAGRLWGRHKLAPNISPNKTWEGVLGGLALVALLSAATIWPAQLSWPESAILLGLSLLCALASVGGDLLMSLMKRHRHIKDAGRLFPGHGGMLDRIDSLLGAAPLFFLGHAWLL